ncbi:hypothetical protein [Polycladidibacter stylochi]|uniref:hypothetical protein n=1 Tax=Polycladidibacter stylochi TaxID=1807766 RepID=UPI000830CC7E|nr:hypothetical protein [Pseudovibrio stylochi]
MFCNNATQEPTKEEVLDALKRVSVSQNFLRSPKLNKFLDFIVKKKLDGKSSELKETIIALNVFNQDNTFKPKSNPVVRVNASRLRSLLKNYYKTQGAHDKVIIKLASIGYIPSFQYNNNAIQDDDKTPVDAELLLVSETDVKETEVVQQQPASNSHSRFNKSARPHLSAHLVHVALLYLFILALGLTVALLSSNRLKESSEAQMARQPIKSITAKKRIVCNYSLIEGGKAILTCPPIMPNSSHSQVN